MSIGWFAQSSESSPNSMSGTTGPVRVRLVCCVGLQQDTWGWLRLPSHGQLGKSNWKAVLDGMKLLKKSASLEWGNSMIFMLSSSTAFFLLRTQPGNDILKG